MTLADKIVRDTESLCPEIERYKNGDLCIHWPIKDRNGVRLTRSKIERFTGIDAELFAVQLLRGRISLHMPAEIANKEVLSGES